MGKQNINGNDFTGSYWLKRRMQDPDSDFWAYDFRLLSLTSKKFWVNETSQFSFWIERRESEKKMKLKKTLPVYSAHQLYKNIAWSPDRSHNSLQN